MNSGENRTAAEYIFCCSPVWLMENILVVQAVRQSLRMCLCLDGEKRQYEENSFQIFCRAAFCSNYFFRCMRYRVGSGTKADGLADAGGSG